MRLPITRLLVANRGEIASRIFRTAHQRGLSTVAVYAPPDAAAPFVRMADLAVPLVGTSAGETYLDVEQLIAAARLAGADAVHPGYGFLAENPDFAQAVLDEGLVWVGPTPDSMRLMGSKVDAKAVATRLDLPVPPSAEIVGDDPAKWSAAAEAVGFPLLVKASAGGGGKGMRPVLGPADLAEAVRAARREAASAFGDATVFVERYLAQARHIEVQIFGDSQGQVIHLGERECSIQRRHQKVVEESPSPGIAPETRELMLEASVTLARSVAYLGAGTVEFLVVGSGGEQELFFLEMNTRLQVEHAVTEAVTGFDLVAMQLDVAVGEPLGITQDQVRFDGHAIEVRVYAEDPAAGHLPSTGTVSRWTETPGVRWDSGVETGSVVTPYYDPMLAKVVAHAPGRTEAAAVLARALRTCRVHGVTTNLGCLAAVLESTPFLQGATTTDFLDRHPDLLAAATPHVLRRAHLVAATLHAQGLRRSAASVLSFAPTGWRNVGGSSRTATFAIGGQPTMVEYRMGAAGAVEVMVDGTAGAVLLHGVSDESVDLEVDGLRAVYAVTAESAVSGDSPADESSARTVWVTGGGWTTRLVEPPRFPVAEGASVVGGLVAPVPGTVTAVLVAAGAEVKVGELLVLVEAMKMEHRITAGVAGLVTGVLVSAGDSVEAHQALVAVEPQVPAETGDGGAS